MASERSVWQPMMVIAPQRIECGRCKALAVFVVLDDDPDQAAPADTDRYDPEDFTAFGYTAWCRPCWEKALEEDDGE